MPPGKDAGVIPETPPVPTDFRFEGTRPTRVRYIVLALTIGAYMITYVDRVVISSAVPSIQKEFGFSIVTMGWILSSFQWGYALFQIPGGWLGDRFGPRRTLTWIVTWWSLFTCATVFAWSAGSMALIRFLFGTGEAGAFPIATRSLSRWMLPTERGFAQGATHAGSRLGGALTPVFVVLIAGDHVSVSGNARNGAGRDAAFGDLVAFVAPLRSVGSGDQLPAVNHRLKIDLFRIDAQPAFGQQKIAENNSRALEAVG